MSVDTYKVVVVGSSGVGKTSMIQRLIEGTFSADKQPTIGVEFNTFQVNCDEETIKINIWDTAGQEKFRSISKAYFRNAVGAVLVFSLIDKNSFDDLNGWLNDLHSLASPNAAILVVGNKCDIQENERQVSNTDASLFAERHGIEYIETSALSDSNIKETFIRLGNLIHSKVQKGEIRGNFKSNPPQLVLHTSNRTQNDQNQGGCC
ncbi:Ras family protein [Histomonas meleagridis]|uniref:Ras family protein n=1 Tax=Histomonas meleagridis TaxID=135588 RepID=UPI00355A53AF|nr:Ras family protein [Histomonas meleagridis]KAH0805910.1 Ras family protein [Histomonas meleagridis]